MNVFTPSRAATPPLQSLLVVALLLIPLNAGAVPEKAQKAFEDKYGNSSSAEWEVDTNGNWEASFKKDGKKHRADFTEDGTWIETERSIEFDALPDAVQSAIRTEFGDREIAEIEEVDSASKGFFYDVEFSEPGKNEDVEYDARGDRLDGLIDAMTTAMGGLNTPLKELETNQKKPHEIGRLELLFEFGLNLITIVIYAFGIYYMRHHNHKMLFLLLAFNLFLFPIFLLNSVLTAGFGFTIFALLALVRLRSDPFDKAEVAYLLGAVALTFINAVLPAGVEIMASVLVLLTAFIADHPLLWRSAYQTTEIRYRLSDPSVMLDQDYLRKKISEDFKVEVNNIEIERIAKNEVRLTVMYRDLPENRKSKKSSK